MSEGVIIAIVAAVAAVIGAIAGIYGTLRKTGAEKKSIEAGTAATEADTAAKYQAIADRAAERALKLDTRICELEDKTQAQEHEIAALTESAARQERKFVALLGYVKKLIDQLRAAHVDPCDPPEELRGLI